MDSRGRNIRQEVEREVISYLEHESQTLMRLLNSKLKTTKELERVWQKIIQTNKIKSDIEEGLHR
jgi:hypothetical protein